MRTRGKYTAATIAAVLTGAALAAAPGTAAAAEGCRWSVSALPIPDGYQLESAGSGDGAGAVAGTLRPASAGPLAGVVWQGDEVRVLGAAFGQNTVLADVSTSGVAVGSYADPHVFGVPDLHHAVRYVDGGFERLPDPPGFTNTAALSVNSRGDILGEAGETAATGMYRPVVWRADAPGTAEVLASPRDRAYVSPVGIDEGGRVAATIYGGDPVGYVWSPGGAPVRLTPTTPDAEVVVGAVAGGLVAGSESGSGGRLWNPDGSVARVLTGMDQPTALNSAGAVAGTAGEATVFLPADGGPAQVVASGDDTIRPTELTESGDIYGLRSSYAPQWRHDMVRWHCG